MGLKHRKTSGPTAPLVKRPVRLGRVDAAAVIAELRQVHEKANDPAIERMPADSELWGALTYLEEHADALNKVDEKTRGAAAVKRAALWQYLREQIDTHQVTAIDHARAAKVDWADLTSALAVRSPSAAYNKAARLRASTLTAADGTLEGRPIRRTPEAVVAAQREKAAIEAAERRREEAARRRHALMLPVARRLLEHRDGLADQGEARDWLDEVRNVLVDCTTPTRMVSLATYVQAAVRELQKLERDHARPAATTEEARGAFAAAVELVSRA